MATGRTTKTRACYPEDLSDLSPRALQDLAAQGISPDSIRELRRGLALDDIAAMRRTERALEAAGLSVEDLCDPRTYEVGRDIDAESFRAWIEGRGRCPVPD